MKRTGCVFAAIVILGSSNAFSETKFPQLILTSIIANVIAEAHSSNPVLVFPSNDPQAANSYQNYQPSYQSSFPSSQNNQYFLKRRTQDGDSYAGLAQKTQSNNYGAPNFEHNVLNKPSSLDAKETRAVQGNTKGMPVNEMNEDSLNTGLETELKPPKRPLGPVTPVQSLPEPSAYDTPAAAISGFSLDLMRVIEMSDSGNTVLSPYSIAVVLALLQQACKEQPRAEIINALHLSPMSVDNFGEMTLNLLQRNSRNTFRMATNIFVGQDFEINELYRNYASRQFGSDITPLNFKQDSRMAVQMINRWISDKTQGYIKDMIPQNAVTMDTQMVLTNAVFFKGIWNATFDKSRTVPLPFKLEDGSTKTAHFMHQNGKYQTGNDQRLDLDYLIMPFEGLQYSLLILVPKKSVGTCLQRLNIADLMRYMVGPTRDAVISIPKFKIRFDTDLIEPLKKLGVNTIFSSSSGLTAIRGSNGESPKVTGALHTAILSIDEQGAKAAAATSIVVNTLSLDGIGSSFRFKADKPFLAFLWDAEQGVPLFASKVVDPIIEN